MLTLIKIAEVVIIYFVIRSVLRMVLPGKRRDAPEKSPGGNPKRFDDKEHDISDADYEEL